MPGALFLSEFIEGKRNAHVLKDLSTGKFLVYCFCCGEEAQMDPFETEQEAEEWAEDWVQKQVELPDPIKETFTKECACNDNHE